MTIIWTTRNFKKNINFYARTSHDIETLGSYVALVDFPTVFAALKANENHQQENVSTYKE